MMPVAPEIDEAGPTREHKGSGTFSHIVSKSPNPMMPGDDVVERCDNKQKIFPLRLAVTESLAGRLSPQRRRVEQWRERVMVGRGSN